MSPEVERWAELLHRLQGAVTDLVPAEAQTHLLNAQRELLTALVIIYEHKAGVLRPPPPAPRRRASPRASRYTGRIRVE